MSRIERTKAVSIFSSQGDRQAQEDFVLANREKGIFVVADGFGGPAAGAAAAKIGCEAVQEFLVKEAGDLDATLPFVLKNYYSLVGNVLFNALIYSNRKVQALNRGVGVHEKGGASVLAGFVDEDLLALASVGNCTAWLFRDGKELQLIQPRSYARLLDPYETEADKRLLPFFQVPLMALGMSEDLEPEIVEYRIRPGDWLLLHTDGLDSVIRQQLLALQCSKGGADALQILKAGHYLENVGACLAVF